MSGLDEDLNNTMDILFNVLSPLLPDASPESIRCLIVSSNLRGVAEAMLQIDEAGIEKLNLKQWSLGLLGTADWLKGDLEEKYEI